MGETPNGAEPPGGPDRRPSGRESIWDYPSPPTVGPSAERVRVVHGGVTVADSTRCLKVCETGHGPTYYIPVEDVRPGVLRATPVEEGCTFKGVAQVHDLVVGDAVAAAAAWIYADPLPGWEAVADHVAFYPSRVEACLLDDERATGDGYGGWVTSRVEGPFRPAAP